MVILVSQRFRLNVTVQSCDVEQPTFNVQSDQTVPITLITGLVLIVLVATFADIIRRLRWPDSSIVNLTNRLWLSFSLCYNSPKVLSTKTSSDSIKPLYGMRVLSLIWIIIAHTYLTMDFRATGRLLLTQNITKGFFFQIILNASLAIETFFFLSGLLVTYSTLRKINSTSQWGKLNWISYYIHRYVRMTPGNIIFKY